MGQKTRTDLLLALLSHLIQKAVGYFVIILLMPRFPKEEMGQFFFWLGVATVAAVFTEMGTLRFIVREVAARPGDATKLTSEAILLRMIVMALMVVGIGGFALVFTPNAATTAVLSAGYVFFDELFYTVASAFIGLRRVGLSVAAMAIGRTTLLALVGVAIFNEMGLHAVLWCHVIGNATLFLAAAVLLRVYVGPLRVAWEPAALARMFAESWPFFVLTLLGMLHFKAGTLLLGAMVSYAAVAAFEAAYKFLEVSRFVIRPAGMVYYPMCAQMAAQGRWDEFVPLFRRLVVVTAAMGLALSVGVWLTADLLVTKMWGQQYEDSATTLRVLFLCTPMLFVEFITLFFAQSMRLERAAIWIAGAALVVSVGTNAAAIPMYGPVGAAWATVATETLLAIGLVSLVVRRTRRLLAEGRSNSSQSAADSADESPDALGLPPVEGAAAKG